MTGKGKRLDPNQHTAIPTTTKLTYEQYQRVKLQAKQENITVSAYIRSVLEQHTQSKTTA